MSNFISNAFMLPNDLIDKGYMALLKGAALPCYLLIVRKTRGWGKTTDSISISQFVDETGYNKDTVLKGSNILEELRIVVKTTSANRTSKYTLTDGIIAVENLDSENLDSENLESRTTELGENLDSNLSKNSTHNNNKNKSKKQKGNFSEAFEKFWSTYPRCKRKSDRPGTLKTFEKHESNFDLQIMISILELQKLDDQWIKQDGDFIPAPSVWLNQRQWENDFWLEKLKSNQQNQTPENTPNPQAPQFKGVEKKYRGVNA